MGRAPRISYARRVTRLYEWLQRHPTLVDGVMAGFLVLFGLAGSFHRAPNIGYATCLLIGVPILFRRRFPLVTFAGVCVIGLAQVLFSNTVAMSDLAVPAALYALAAYRSRRLSVPGLGLCMVGALLAMLRWVQPIVNSNSGAEYRRPWTE